MLDAAPLIESTPSLSSLIAQADVLLTTPRVIAEIKSPDARQRVETLYKPFVRLRVPTLPSMKHVLEFTKKTGDSRVLSREDLEIIALAYEVDNERKRELEQAKTQAEQTTEENKNLSETQERQPVEATEKENGATVTSNNVEEAREELEKLNLKGPETKQQPSEVPGTKENRPTGQGATQAPAPGDEEAREAQNENNEADDDDDDDDDGGGWITPSNLKKHKAKDAQLSGETSEPKSMRTATITGDFAMQNVLLQMGLNLLSPHNMQRIRQLKSYVLRCHACFLITKDMDKQFCPRCGKPTLNRVTATTSANGELKIHLKKNYQYNGRGDRFSIPKPVHGNASGKWKGGGGQGGWGMKLITSADQKEYTKRLVSGERQARKEHDLMDADFMPGILTGDRHKGGGRIKIGAGRDVNARSRRKR